jgi:hypothetical protein
MSSPESLELPRTNEAECLAELDEVLGESTRIIDAFTKEQCSRVRLLLDR